jgi:hypothetical protein
MYRSTLSYVFPVLPPNPRAPSLLTLLKYAITLASANSSNVPTLHATFAFRAEFSKSFEHTLLPHHTFFFLFTKLSHAHTHTHTHKIFYVSCLPTACVCVCVCVCVCIDFFLLAGTRVKITVCKIFCRVATGRVQRLQRHSRYGNQCRV